MNWFQIWKIAPFPSLALFGVINVLRFINKAKDSERPWKIYTIAAPI